MMKRNALSASLLAMFFAGPAMLVTLPAMAQAAAADITAPSTPAGLSVTATTASTAGITWTASTDNVGVKGYRIYVGSVMTEIGATTTHTLTGLVAGATVYVQVSSVDEAGNESGKSARLRVTAVADTEAPGVPAAFEASDITSTSAVLSWEAPSDNVGVAGYDVYRNGIPVGHAASNRYLLEQLSPDHAYAVSVKAVDAAGNASAFADASFRTLEKGGENPTPPAPPTDLKITGISQSTATLSWKAPAVLGPVAGYDVYQNGNIVKTVEGAGSITVAVEQLFPNAVFDFAVRSRGKNGVGSSMSNVVRSHTMPRPGGDTADYAPHYPTHLRVIESTYVATTIGWDFARDDNSLPSYIVYKDGLDVLHVGPDENTAVVVTPVGGKLHEITVEAVDSLGQITRAPPLHITVPMKACDDYPSVSGPVTRTAANAASITMAIPEATQPANCGKLVYKIYRDNELVGETGVPAFTDSALEAGKSYSYEVVAENELGNSGKRSTPASLATLGINPAPLAVGYFEAWGVWDRKFFVKDVYTSGQAERLTHIQYAFGNVQPKVGGGYQCEVGKNETSDPVTGVGGDAYVDYAASYEAADSVDGKADAWDAPLRGSWGQLMRLKKLMKDEGHDLKVLISLGGWTWSRHFAEAARPENRVGFVKSCIDAYVDGNLPEYSNAGGRAAAAGLFDGIDIDWEYPVACGLECDGRPEDRANQIELMKEFRKQLDDAQGRVGRKLSLSAAVGAGIDKIRATDVAKLHENLDFISLMTYDFHGGWEARTNHQSALFPATDDPSVGDVHEYNAEAAVQAFMANGVPADKLLLGLPFYGRGWKGVTSANDGLYQPATGMAAGRYEPGINDYKVLKALQWTRHEDNQAHASWIYDATTDGGTFWTFDGPDEITAKVEYAKLHGLGGVLIWALSGDDNGELTRAAATALDTAH